MILNLNGAGGGGKTGATLAITSSGAGTLTVSNSAINKSYSQTVTAGSTVEFKGLASGTWTVTLSDGSNEVTQTVKITADYSASIAFFSATINVTYPAGSTCSCSDGITTLTAPDTSGSVSFSVPSTGAWTVSCTDGTSTNSKTVGITAEGQSENVTLAYELVLFDSSVTSGWELKQGVSGYGSGSISNGKITVQGVSGTTSDVLFYKTEPVPTSGYTTAKIIVDSATVGTQISRPTFVLQSTPNATLTGQASNVAAVDLTGAGTFSLPLPSGTYYVGINAIGNSTVTVSKVWFE